MGHSLGLTVIAAGVETETHHEVLASLGNLAVQGYLFNRPEPALVL